jgi:hypothetical protein
MNQDVTVGGIFVVIGRTANVASERDLLNSPVDPGFFESLERRGLRVRQSRFDAAFGENPAPAA